MSAKQNEIPAEGWKGGFLDSNPDFNYPTPDLSSLPLPDNLQNIDKIQRQMKVLWPEFSWETKPGEEDPERCYTMFSPDVSRIGYSDSGRVYSIICPQQGIHSPSFGSMNVEVTVTGTRGWVNEDTKEMAADMSVVGKIWFSPSSHQGFVVKHLWDHFAQSKQPFPSTKKDAIIIETNKIGFPDEPIFPLTKGQDQRFPNPEWTKHEDEAWTVATLDVQIGKVKKTGSHEVDHFNQMIVDIFNLTSGNMLKEKNILSWNVWFTPPELVDQDEWANHAEYWRESIDSDHGSPTGPGTDSKYFDGTPFKVSKGKMIKGMTHELYEYELQKEEHGHLYNFLHKIEGDAKDKIMSMLHRN
jgi:hypothetical protein